MSRTAWHLYFCPELDPEAFGDLDGEDPVAEAQQDLATLGRRDEGETDPLSRLPQGWLGDCEEK